MMIFFFYCYLQVGMTEDNNYEEEAPEETHIRDPKQKNPPRGSTKGKQILKNKLKGKKEKMNYNQRSQPIGKEAIRYTTYLGALARNGWVPITLPDWHHADNVSLDMIWKEMKVSTIFLLVIKKVKFFFFFF